MSEPTPNAAQAEFWTGDAGRHWVDEEAAYDAMHTTMAVAIIDALAPTSNERILDIGAGTGALSRTVAQLVRPRGTVVALDISSTMAARAAEHLADLGLEDTVVPIVADAQVHAFDGPPFDAVMSRFGVMFFDDPVAAFTNIGRAVRPGGRLVFACWQQVADNEFMELPMAVIRRHVDLPDEPPTTVGPFAFADPDHVTSILDASGWVDMSIMPLVGTYHVAGNASVDDAVAFSLGRALLVERMRYATPDQRDAVRRDLTDEFAARHDGTGVAFGYACWLVTATRPS